ncbi:MAG: arylesterase, partial [Nevskiales bacterium]
RLILAGLLLPLLIACGNDAASISLPSLGSDARILAFGDSITYGTGAKRGQGYPEQLANKLGLEVVNAGVPGETTAGGLKRLPKLLKNTQPDLVILCLGGNDFLKRLDVSLTQENLASMLRILKDQQIPVVLMAVPKFGVGITGNLSPHPLYAELAKDFDVILENEVISEVLSERELKADPIHPNAKGYAELASALAVLLAKHGAVIPAL